MSHLSAAAVPAPRPRGGVWRRFLPALLLAATAVCGSPASAAVFPYAYTKEVLPNGLTVIVVPMESPGVVAYYSIVRTGSRDEVEAGKSGFAHFFEHMMFRGTAKYPSDAYEAIITRMGASTNAFTTDDLTAYHLLFGKEDLAQVMEIESDRFQNLAYSEQAFQTEAGAIYGEFRKNITSPFSLLNEKMQDLAYDVHTYKHTTMGFEADIKAMPQGFEYSRSFFNRFYRPDNVVLLIVGDVEPTPTLALVRRYYGAWKPGYVPPRVQPEPPQRGERTGEVTYPGKTLPILDIAYKGESFQPNDREYVAALLIEELAFGETSELHKKLLIQEQKVQMLGASVPMNRDQPLFEIYAMVKKPEDVGYVRDEVYRTLETFQRTPVDTKRLEDLKRRNKYSFLMSLDTPDAVARGLARLLALTGDLSSIEMLYAQMENLTPADIQRAAQTYFTPERRTVVVLKGAKS
ncbi:pitrilysin family protein [Opitutus sp. ER46]|uniref:M16 family metallopeptidase n=1 Tax=Opitutus sp. ER46 TaxID=2161864 RepID=UPI000D308980|nr:pitrilysin family protein [Opitutus sp. ER46]PTX98581.1 insulinase family protein [Opitutus sp. ER46]